MSGYHQRVLTGSPRYSDVPVERGLVGAMGITAPLDTFVPYVYRGTGEDTLPGISVEIAEAEAKAERHKRYAKMKRESRRKAKPRPQRKPRFLETSEPPLINLDDLAAELLAEVEAEPPAEYVKAARSVAPISAADIEALLDE